MPGPLISNPLPSWLQPEGASVFDSPITKGLRAVAHWTGMDDPNQVMSVASPMNVMGMAAGKTISNEVHPAVKALLEMLDQGPSAVNPDKFVEQSRVTPRFLPPAPKFVPPEGFEIGDIPPRQPKSFRDAVLRQDGYSGGFGRSPQNDEIYSQQQAALKQMMSKPPLDPRKLPPPPLSGRWGGKTPNR